MGKKDEKVTIPACKHPLDQAFDQPREDGSGKWDKICGLCGITMCEVTNKAAEPVLCGNTRCSMFKTSDPGNCRAIADMIDSTGEQKSADGCKDFKPLANFPETPHVTIDEIGPDGDDDREQICVNDECPNFDAGVINGCNQLEHVYECESVLYAVNYETKEEGDAGPEEEAEAEGAEEVEQADGDDAGADAAEPVGELVPRPDAMLSTPFSSDGNLGPKPYVTRSPDKVGGRFQELLPVPVDDHELADLGAQMAEKHSLWLKTKLDAKKFAKACKEVTDRCEEEMEELGLIIQDHARMAPVDCQWEYDFMARVKRLRRCDTWEIVKEETLTIEECQGSFDFQQQQSEAAVEQLRQAQAPEEVGTEEPDTTCQHCKDAHSNCDGCCAICQQSDKCNVAQFCTLPGVLDNGTLCAVCTGECGDYTPGTSVSECPGFLRPAIYGDPACDACGKPVADHENVGIECNLHPGCAEGGVCAICVSPYHCTADDAQFTPKHGKKACREYAADLDKDQVAWRDGVCRAWRGCPHSALCFGPANESDACDCISDKLKEQEVLF